MPAAPHTLVTFCVQSWIYGVAQLRWSVPPMPVPVMWSRHPCTSIDYPYSILAAPTTCPYTALTVLAHIVVAYVRACAWVCVRVRRCGLRALRARNHVYRRTRARARALVRANKRVRALVRAHCAARGTYRQEVPVGRIARLLRDRPYLQRLKGRRRHSEQCGHSGPSRRLWRRTARRACVSP